MKFILYNHNYIFLRKIVLQQIKIKKSWVPIVNSPTIQVAYQFLIESYDDDQHHVSDENLVKANQ